MKFSAIIDSLSLTTASRRKRSKAAPNDWASAGKGDTSKVQDLDLATLPVLTPSSSSPATPMTPRTAFSQSDTYPLSPHSPVIPLSPLDSADPRTPRTDLPSRKLSIASLSPSAKTKTYRRPSLPTLLQSAKSPKRVAPLEETNALEAQIKRVREAVMGEGALFKGPFGSRRVTYADYTASGRSLTFIEDYIRSSVLPFYANTHTEASLTGRQTSRFRDDARAIIHQAVGGMEEDVVLFGGSGSTWGVNRMVDVLGLKDRPPPDDGSKPVVFIGPYEHHSNILPWREANVDVVAIGQTTTGQIDQAELADRLAQFADRSLKIGSFSAASNVTGIVSDVDGITALLHEHGALAFWDYAAAAPYVDINMNPDGCADGPRSKDAIFISPHKFVGGPGTPGILVAKRRLFQQQAPCGPGGGTVAFVTNHGHMYDTNIEHREEGGTPDIIGCIRAGLVFQLKQSIGADFIERRERVYGQVAMAHWSKHPNIEILGDTQVPQLSIISFIVRHQSRALHYNFVVALLNDLFGIQARGGCSCAGPYGADLLNIDGPLLDQFTDAIAAGYGGMKPGWTRLSFNYFTSLETFRFILGAVDFVASHGHAFLSQYRFDLRTGLWDHQGQQPVRGLLDMDMLAAAPGHASEDVFGEYLKEARRLAMVAAKTGPQAEMQLPEAMETIRWFASCSRNHLRQCSRHMRA